MQREDNRPIGVFDSGLGGLTALMCLAKLLPEERFVYFGDTARTPYGSKAVDTIQKFAVEISEFLLRNNVKMIVIACNTVSATCLEVLNERFHGIPIIGIIEPAAQEVARLYDGKRIGIIGTKVTVFSRQYEKVIREFAPDCIVFSKACPLFVPAIEEGLGDTELMEPIVRHYMDAFVEENDIEVLILGCTHYPLVADTIKRLYPDIIIVNPSEIVAQRVIEVLDRYGMHASEGQGDSRFFVSDMSECFVKMAQKINPVQEVSIKLKNFENDSDRY